MIWFVHCYCCAGQGSDSLRTLVVINVSRSGCLWDPGRQLALGCALALRDAVCHWLLHGCERTLESRTPEKEELLTRILCALWLTDHQHSVAHRHMRVMGTVLPM